MRRGREHGQAAVELALSLPLVVLLLLAAVQTGVIVRDQILVVHASREAARAAVVTAEEGAARRAASASSSLIRDRLSVDSGRRPAAGAPLRVVVRYRAPTDVALIGRFLPDILLRADTTMRVEV